MGKKLIVDGIEYSSIKECCDEIGLEYSSITRLRSKYKELSAEQLLRMVKTGIFHEYVNPKIKVFVRGKEYNTLRDCCVALSIDGERLINYKLNNQQPSYTDIIVELLEYRARNKY